METKFNRPPRNDDRVNIGTSNLSIFKKKGCPKGSSKSLLLDVEEFNEALIYMLQNCEEVWPFIE